jgi:hypothetical protein
METSLLYFEFINETFRSGMRCKEKQMLVAVTTICIGNQTMQQRITSEELDVRLDFSLSDGKGKDSLSTEELRQRKIMPAMDMNTVTSPIN